MARKRRRYESHEVEEEPEPFFPEVEEPEPFWREEGVPHNLPKSYGRTNDFFTIKMRACGRFIKFGGHRVYSGGWVRYLDYCEGCRLTLIWLMYALREMGLTGICFLYYKKPMTSLDDGLVQLKTQEDVEDMIRWSKGVREIGIFVTHPSRKLAKSLLLGEMYDSIRKFWPKATLKELSDEETLLSALKENTKIPLLPWYPEGIEEVEVEGGQGIEEMEVQGGEGMEEREVHGGQGIEEREFEGGQSFEEREVEGVEGMDTFMNDNNIVFEDIDWETQAFMREENYGEDYESVEGEEMEGETNEAYNEIDGGACYADEEGMFEDLGPVMYDIGPLPESLFEHSNQLHELSENETEGEEEVGSSRRRLKKKNENLQYDSEANLQNPVLIPNMVFATAADFKKLVREYAVATKKPIKFVKNEPMRVRVKCVNADCAFFVLCSQVGTSRDLCIKTMNKNHTCGTSIKIPTISVKWLAKRYVNKVRRTPTISMNAFIGDVYDDLKVEISRSTAHRAIKAAGYLMYGNETRQFARLWSYAKELIDIMPGSTVIIKQEEQKFQRIYVCPSPLKKGFLAGCRRFVCLDGCFLKGSFKGQILAAVGLDADNGIYPVAWAVVEVENTDSWTWFVRLLKEDLVMDRQPDSWVLMTDQQKGLEIAIKNELPDAEHRLCVKHLHANWSKKFPGKVLKNMMWKCARAANEPYFKVKMQQLRNVSLEGYEALCCIDPRKWARHAFRPGTNCVELTNNWAEAFNVFIIRSRDQPIITMLNTIYHTIMTRIVEQREKKLNCRGPVGPRIAGVLQKREEKLHDFIVRASGSPRYEVTSANHSFVVDIEKKECSCGLWQLGGTPCMHGVCVYKSKNKDPRKYVHSDFLLSTWFKIYNNFLEPLRGPMFWTKSPYPDILPPDIRVLPGRPKRIRKKDAAEISEEADKRKSMKGDQANKGVFKASRKGSVIHCKICGGIAHNARTCPKKPAS